MENTALVPVVEDLPIEAEVLSMLPADAETDIREARNTYKDIIKSGKKGLEVAEKIVEGSEHPRAIEVFATLISNLANVNQKLVDLHRTTKELTDGIQPTVVDNSSKQVANNLFVGSPKELLEMLQDAKE